MIVRHRSFESTTGLPELMAMSRGLITNRGFGVGDSRREAIDRARAILAFLRNPESEKVFFDVSTGLELATMLRAQLSQHRIPTREIGTTYREIDILAERWQLPALAS